MNDIDTLTLEINNKVAELEQLRQDIVKAQNEEANKKNEISKIGVD